MRPLIQDDCLKRFGQQLYYEIERFGVFREFEPQQPILQQGHYPKYLPIIIKGCIKVCSGEGSKQILLYYVLPDHPIILSFFPLYNSHPLEFSAVCERRTEILLIPIDKAKEWVSKYSTFAHLVLMDFQQQYNELLHHARTLNVQTLEERLLTYLKIKSVHCNSTELSLTHQSIADELGTTREVISRILKKLVVKNIISTGGRKIKIIEQVILKKLK